MTAKELINVDPEIMGGTPVFQGTRVPVQYLFDHLENNATIDEFLAGYPSVSKNQAIALIHLMSHGIVEGKLLDLNENFA
ncbi:DUF433 domain-containing protein [Spirosoma validum]|uniref:DUF433 domain-containing protein n=1 Tax=Spirosoma validum TaxID=2771355 RepID=A0A927GEB1_9BACT|nr:DUF433 domain-containing protein [Spirosoma validum]MBD2754508.1 DUF433 domain-containing protein [Spirosoma validum]